MAERKGGKVASDQPATIPETPVCPIDPYCKGLTPGGTCDAEACLKKFAGKPGRSRIHGSGNENEVQAGLMGY